ncbi:MAG: murein biosynthesis integral membrane protein MurJ [Gammaproteobacteria bacterium]|nr:murein biosynthesis integral membrane protein MurJ [Gammaproteobacteria bacterium]MCP5423873.1 murein biosynthesis integral membrane protein MurJ [Gammaproteobacteria bacterium]
MRNRTLLKSTGVVSAMTFVSRILGFVRDMVFAQFFGAGTATDAFFVAFRIPNLMRRLFAEGAFSLAFVPVFSQYRTQRSHQELQQLTDAVAGTLSAILMAVTALGILAAPLLVWTFAPGFSDDQDKYTLTVAMLRITFPYLLFISLTAMAGGILNSCGRFAIPALTPAILNIVLIIAAIGVAPSVGQPVVALAWGVFFAGLLQLLFQLPYLEQLRLLPRPRWAWRSPGVQKILKLMLPTLFGSSVAQVNLLFSTLLASFLVSGSVSWLYYSDRLVEFPLGIFGVALGTVILPNLSRKHAAASADEFSHMLDWALRMTLLIGLPATIALVILAGPLLATLFQYGEFGAHDVLMASRSLMAYALGLLAFMLVKVLAPGFYARQDTRTPVRIGVVSMLASMILNLILVIPLAHAGLALGASLSSYLNAFWLFHLLRQRGVYRPPAGWARFLWQVGAANLFMGLILWYGSGAPSDWVAATAHQRAMHLALLVGGGFLTYLAGVLLVGIRPHHLKVKV